MPLAVERLRELLAYDADRGTFTRCVRMGRFLSGTIAGSVQKNGYLAISVDGKKYLAHRLAIFYVTGEWPSADVDHRGLTRTDNRFAELRPATRQQNMQNTRKHRDNTSGYKGVSWDRRRGFWRATIQINGKWTYLGRFQKLEDARDAYVAAASNNFGQFARAA